MCGSVRHEQRSSKIGDLVVTTAPAIQKTKDCKWTGFVQLEKAKWWKEQSAGVEVYIAADVFVEGKLQFKVPGHKMVGLYLTKAVKINGKVIGPAGTVKLVTRAPMNSFEKKIHSRWPLVRTFQTYAFGEQDVATPRQLSLLQK